MREYRKTEFGDKLGREVMVLAVTGVRDTCYHAIRYLKFLKRLMDRRYDNRKRTSTITPDSINTRDL